MSEPTVVSETFVEREGVPFVVVEYSNGIERLFRIEGNGLRVKIDAGMASSIRLKSSRTDEKTALALGELHAAYLAASRPPHRD
jgi:hypothetical protein